MHGLGDNLHQRPIIRQLADRNEVYLETSWPIVYHDMPDVKLLRRGTTLRTQLKNCAREADAFHYAQPPNNARRMKIDSPPNEIRLHKSVHKAMAARTGCVPGDFRLPVRDAWLNKADARLHAAGDRPVMFVRPLVERKEWTGGVTRNPDPAHYLELYKLIRERFYTVSVADLVPHVEWEIGGRMDVDLKFHKGELDAEEIFGIVARSDLVYGAPGFQTVLAQALSRPGVTVFGGYEAAYSFSTGAGYAPWLAIEPETPCPCFTHVHKCPKDIDLSKAKQRLAEFVNAVLSARVASRDYQEVS